jgi:paraquat-inducible protein B
MSKKANPTLVGGFALGAIALIVLAIVLLGSGSLFRYRPKAVAFFQGNIQGLNVGAPVTLDGVSIGTVTDIKIEVTRGLVPLIPVYMEFDPERLHFSDAAVADDKNQALLKAAIARGLHARLGSQSLVTGQLLVDLSFDASEEARVVGADPKTVEIPTSLSDIEKLKNVLANIPLDQIASTLLRTLNDIDTVVKSPQIPALLTSLADASKSINELAATTRNELPPLIANVNQTVKTASGTLGTANATLNEMHNTFAIANRLLNTDIRGAVDSAQKAVQRADQLLSESSSLVEQSSAQRYDIDQILRNLSATTRSLRSFTDEIDRRPNAVILGK